MWLRGLKTKKTKRRACLPRLFLNKPLSYFTSFFMACYVVRQSPTFIHGPRGASDERQGIRQSLVLRHKSPSWTFLSRELYIYYAGSNINNSVIGTILAPTSEDSTSAHLTQSEFCHSLRQGSSIPHLIAESIWCSMNRALPQNLYMNQN